MSRTLKIVFALICLIIGGGTMVSDAPLQRLCRTDCWFNYLLLAIGGDSFGKFVLGSIWIAGGLWLLYKALHTSTRIPPRRHRRSHDG
jgi:hypothetical protein